MALYVASHYKVIKITDMFTKWVISLESCTVATIKVKYSSWPLGNQTWQTEWKTAPLAEVQLCEYENQTLEAFVAASHSYVKYER